MLRILLLMDLSREPNRCLLRGVTRYTIEHEPWEFFQLSSFVSSYSGRRGPSRAEYNEQILQKAAEIKADAILGNWPEIDLPAAKELGIPIVLRSVDKVYEDMPMLLGKYQKIGKMAADFFLSRNYRSFAFIGIANTFWSEERRLGYTEAAKAAGMDVNYLLIKDTASSMNDTKEWLSSLPPQTALFACNDLIANYITDICRLCGIKIPDDISLLGADNDEFLCNISSPRISSIKLDFEREGYELAQRLEEAVEGKIESNFHVYLEPIDIVERDSTKRHSIKDPHIAKLVEYFDKHFKEDINLEKELDKIPLSRRSIEMKFSREMGGVTILQYLTGLRVDNMKYMLAHTDMLIAEVAYKSGFDDPLNISRIFKKYTGYTPTEYRKIQNSVQASK